MVSHPSRLVRFGSTTARPYSDSLLLVHEVMIRIMRVLDALYDHIMVCVTVDINLVYYVVHDTTLL